MDRDILTPFAVQLREVDVVVERPRWKVSARSDLSRCVQAEKKKREKAEKLSKFIHPFISFSCPGPASLFLCMHAYMEVGKLAERERERERLCAAAGFFFFSLSAVFFFFWLHG